MRADNAVFPADSFKMLAGRFICREPVNYLNHSVRSFDSFRLSWLKYRRKPIICQVHNPACNTFYAICPSWAAKWPALQLVHRSLGVGGSFSVGGSRPVKVSPAKSSRFYGKKYFFSDPEPLNLQRLPFRKPTEGAAGLETKVSRRFKPIHGDSRLFKPPPGGGDVLNPCSSVSIRG